MITFEKFKEILTDYELQKFNELELEKIYTASTIFADFSYKKWIDIRDESEKKV